MTALRKEPEPQLQQVSATALAELMSLCTARAPCPNDKLIRNICAMAWSDPAETPSAAAAAAMAGDAQHLERLQSHKAAGGRGGGAAAAAAAALVGDAAAVAGPGATDSPEAVAARTSRLGAEAALKVGRERGAWRTAE